MLRIKLIDDKLTFHYRREHVKIPYEVDTICHCIKEPYSSEISEAFHKHELFNDMSNGCLEMVNDTIKNMPCYHGTVGEVAPMFFPEAIVCARSWAIEESYCKIAFALEKKGMSEAAEYVALLLIERKAAKNEMEGTEKDRS